MNLNDILLHTCGVNNKQQPKSSIHVSLERLKAGGDLDKPNIIQEMATKNPVIQLTKTQDFIQLDFVFKNYHDPELRMFWNILERFGKELRECDTSKEFPFFSIAIVPDEYEGTIYEMAYDPVFWTLQPSTVNGKTDTVRLLVKENKFGFFQTNEIDAKAIIADIDRQLQYEQNLQALEEQEEAQMQKEEAEGQVQSTFVEKKEHVYGTIALDDANDQDETNDNNNGNNNNSGSRFRYRD